MSKIAHWKEHTCIAPVGGRTFELLLLLVSGTGAIYYAVPAAKAFVFL